MTVSIPPEFQQFVAQQIAGGEYRSAEEIVSAGLRALQELKRRQSELRAAVQVGLDQLERGEGITLQQDALRGFFDQIQSRGRQRYEASKAGQ